MQFRAIEWLENISSEKNTIIQGFDKLEIKSMNAADSQALLQLKKHYCNGYNCLNCSIGNAILVKSEIETVAR